jgi:hypothetical protein
MELIPNELPQILPLDHMLDAHMAAQCPQVKKNRITKKAKK